MDKVPAQRPARRSHVNNSLNQFRYTAPLTRQTRRRKPNKVKASNVPPALRAQAAELRSAKTNLDRTYAQEQNVQELSSRCIGITFNFPEVTAARARAERRYVNCLVRYLRGANQMSAQEARPLQGDFTKRKMKTSGTNNCAYLLGLYPHELK
jgi:hypothetical protein